MDLLDFLDELPPPPPVNEDDDDENLEIDVFDFIGPPEADVKAKYELKDPRHELISGKARSIPQSSRNQKVLLELNMKLSNASIMRSPSYINKNGESYPKTTDIKCWWCRNTFKTQPIGIPFKRSKNKNEFVCSGNFCSFECAMAAANDSHSRKLKLFAGSLLCLMRKAILKISLETPLLSAPHWSALREYGGFMSIEEFRENKTTVRAVPENLRLFPIGFNIFSSKRKIDKTTKPARKTNLIFEAKKRAKIAKKSKNAPRFFKTNFSATKIKLKRSSGKTKRLNLVKPKKRTLTI